MFSIGMAAMIIGVCKKTLRRWEKKDLLTPMRTPGHPPQDVKPAISTFFPLYRLNALSFFIKDLKHFPPVQLL